MLLLCTEEADDEAEDAVERSSEFDGEGISTSILPPLPHFSSCLSLRLGLKLVLLGLELVLLGLKLVLLGLDPGIVNWRSNIILTTACKTWCAELEIVVA